MEISGDPGPLLAAAITAALLRLAEEHAAASAVPAGRPTQGKWVLSGMPRRVETPFVARPTPPAEGWSVGSERDDDL